MILFRASTLPNYYNVFSISHADNQRYDRNPAGNGCFGVNTRLGG
jgi:hypothetical protein